MQSYGLCLTGQDRRGTGSPWVKPPRPELSALRDLTGMRIEENLKAWNDDCRWPKEGDEWSERWGSSTAQWYCTLLPRIYEFLPTGTILEIAPGHGRWTQFLKALCKRLIVVDLSPNCIEACKKRFSSDGHIIYHVNDGTSLEMIPDRSVDFVFTFDSLVHAEADVIRQYLIEISRKLTTNGGGFIHHSALGDFPWLIWFIKGSKRLRLYQHSAFIQRQEHWRAYSMTASLFRTFCREAALSCTRQELVNWDGTRFCIDCLSTFKRRDSESGDECVVVRNPNFMLEAERASCLSKVYA